MVGLGAWEKVTAQSKEWYAHTSDALQAQLGRFKQEQTWR